jgi:signal recognition particle subunit SRP54
VGEKTTALELFHPDRVASRILGMGDVVSLVEDVQRTVDVEEAQKLAAKVKKGKGFDLNDLLMQFQQMKKMGGMSSLLDKLPGMPNVPQGALDQVNDKHMAHMEAIIYSMTPHERAYPAVIKGSRKRRIAAGCGLQVQDVNRLLKQYQQMQKMMKKMGKGGLKNMMRGMKGRMPPGLM